VPVVTAARVEAMIGVTRPTAQSAIDALVERGDLIETTGRERNRIYEAPAIFQAVYGPIEVPTSGMEPLRPVGDPPVTDSGGSAASPHRRPRTAAD
jgi:hypothetical protein